MCHFLSDLFSCQFFKSLTHLPTRVKRYHLHIVYFHLSICSIEHSCCTCCKLACQYRLLINCHVFCRTGACHPWWRGWRGPRPWCSTTRWWPTGSTPPTSTYFRLASRFRTTTWRLEVMETYKKKPHTNRIKTNEKLIIFESISMEMISYIAIATVNIMNLKKRNKWKELIWLIHIQWTNVDLHYVQANSNWNDNAQLNQALNAANVEVTKLLRKLGHMKF